MAVRDSSVGVTNQRLRPRAGVGRGLVLSGSYSRITRALTDNTCIIRMLHKMWTEAIKSWTFRRIVGILSTQEYANG